MVETNSISNISVTPPIELPYVLKDKVLFDAGTWTSMENIPANYTKMMVQKLFRNTDWSEKSKDRYVFLQHMDGSPLTWVGWIRNERYEDGRVRGDIEVVDLNFALKLKVGDPYFGTSAKVAGVYNPRTHDVIDGKFENFNIVLDPAVKTAYFNNAEGLRMSEEATNAGIKVPVQTQTTQAPQVVGVKPEDVLMIVEKKMAEENAKREALAKEELRVKQEQELKKKVEDTEKLISLKEKEIADAKALKDKELADIKAKLDAAELKLKEPTKSIGRGVPTQTEGATSQEPQDSNVGMLKYLMDLRDGVI